MEEVWKPVKGFEDFYEVSNFGRVRSLDRVIVIREEDGKRVQYAHDMRSKDIVDSPCYYLQQNDIVYVEPKYKKNDGEDKAIQYISIITSLASTAAAVLWYITR